MDLQKLSSLCPFTLHRVSGERVLDSNVVVRNIFTTMNPPRVSGTQRGRSFSVKATKAGFSVGGGSSKAIYYFKNYGKVPNQKDKQ
jgi:hypothetical protein